MKQKLLISFSGGRTSAYMTKWILENWSDKYEIVVVFANTGKEYEETLEFIRDCDFHFGFNTIWIEAVTNMQHGKGVSANIVNFKTASRNGKPFLDFVKKHGMPNVQMSICTRELKSSAIKSYARSIGWKKFYTAIGIRADEFDRVSSNYKEQRFIYPLVNLGIRKTDINKFWVNNSFDLNLKGYQGNCDLCFKKSLRKLLTIIKESPEKTKWWEDLELNFENFTPSTRKQAGLDITRRIFRNNLSIYDLIELSKQPFEPAKDDSKYIDTQLSLFDLDVSNGCEESCEVF